jgi:sporadic carbohydrate cluster protein (TIGR04323 family)
VSEPLQLRGYGTSRSINGLFVPQRLQNMVIRQYVDSIGGEFLLSAFEYHMADSYMMLRKLIDEIDEVDGLVFYALGQLPDDHELLLHLSTSILEKKKQLHFATEQLTVTNSFEWEHVSDILAIQKLTANIMISGV